jgi:DNA-binding NtrC family response regulator
MARICVIDDQELIRDSLRTILEREDHSVAAFADPREALEHIRRSEFDAVITDLKMPRMDGLTLIREMRATGCEAAVVMMTAFATVPTAVEAIKLGAFDYIQKPFEADRIVVLVERALEHGRLQRENEALRASVEELRPQRDLVGAGRAMSALRASLLRIAASHETVLLCGESGTGKELAAAFIHRRSPRAGRPMLCLNCAALSANLLESELFGHERGAFTGADRTRKGRFELADGGTLLLDEISEMDLALQAKLLRVLQEGEFERVGSSLTRRSNVRVIATTNRDLSAWVGRGRFRSDLFFRLNVLPVQLPPLRDREEDIPELTRHFLDQATGASGAVPLETEPDALRLLMDYAWPGNVRELENLCRRAATLASDGTMTSGLIRPWLAAPAVDAPHGASGLRDGNLLEDMERQLIERTLARFGGHRVKSARALGMGVRTLGLKLKQWRVLESRDAVVVADGA